jgi:hypothetical protein
MSTKLEQLRQKADQLREQIEVKRIDDLATLESQEAELQRKLEAEESRQANQKEADMREIARLQAAGEKQLAAIFSDLLALVKKIRVYMEITEKQVILADHWDLAAGLAYYPGGGLLTDLFLLMKSLQIRASISDNSGLTRWASELKKLLSE